MRADHASIIADIKEMVEQIVGEFGIDTEITLDTTFREDLEMESIDLVSLAGRLQARYGNSVNFAQFIAGMNVDNIPDMKVGELVEFVAKALDEAQANGGAANNAAGAPETVEAVSS